MAFNIKNNYGPNIEVNDGGEVTLVQGKNGRWHTEEAEEASNEEVQEDVKGKRSEELFHFVHPELGDDEAWRIHQAIKRLVANYRVPEICKYLKELKQSGKLMLPPNPSTMYSELVRLGMPKGEGFSEKNFSNSYMK